MIKYRIFKLLLLLVIIVLGGWFCWSIFYQGKVFSKTPSLESTLRPGIYFVSANKLYLYDLTSTDSLPQKVINLSDNSSDNISEITLANKGYLYETKTTGGLSTIYRLNFVPQISEKAFSVLTPGLQNFSSFSKPQFSHDFNTVAFTAFSGGFESLFIYDLTNNKLTNLTPIQNQGLISDFAWSADDKSLAVVFSDLKSSTIKILSPIAQEQTLSTVFLSISQIVYLNKTLVICEKNSDDGITFLKEIDLSTKQIVTLSSVKLPSEIKIVRTSSDQKYLLYSADDATTKKSSLFLLNLDKNTNQKVNLPIMISDFYFSPDNSHIVYLTSDHRLYTIKVSDISSSQEIDIDNIIDNLISWR